MQEIEKFFIEFFISIRNNLDIFSDFNHELKYLEYSMITTINEILLDNKQNLDRSKNSVEAILHKINKKLFEDYMNFTNTEISQKKTLIISNLDEKKKDEEKKSAKDKDIPNYLEISKLNILKELFNTFEGFSKSDKEKDAWEFEKDKDEMDRDNQIKINRNYSKKNKDLKNIHLKQSLSISSKNYIKRNSTSSSKDTIKENFFKINREYTINLSKFDEKHSVHHENNESNKLNYFFI